MIEGAKVVSPKGSNTPSEAAPETRAEAKTRLANASPWLAGVAVAVVVVGGASIMLLRSAVEHSKVPADRGPVISFEKQAPAASAPATAEPPAPAPASTTSATTTPVTATPAAPAPALAAPAPAAAPAETAQPVQVSGYFVQGGAFLVPENAEKLVRKLADQGLPAHRKIMLGKAGKVWHHVEVGPYTTREAAQRAAALVKQAAKIDPFVTRAGDPG